MSNTYPFDPTGTLPSNKVINELKNPGIGNGVDAFLVVPDATPFYKDGFSLVNSQGDTLLEGVHYYLTHQWQQAADHVGRAVYGSVVLLGTTSYGPLKLNYQTIGGSYVDNRANVITDGLTALSTIVTVDWSTAPTTFPSTPHNHTLNSLSGMSDILNAIDRIQTALAAPVSSINMDDIQDLDVEFLEPLFLKLDALAIAINTNNNIGTQLLNLQADVDVMEINITNLLNITTPASSSKDGLLSKEDFVLLHSL